MKNLIFNSILLAGFLLVSCTKEETKQTNNNIATVANLSIAFNNTVSGMAINNDNTNYTNAIGNKYTIDILKYYVTNIVLEKDNGALFYAKNYNLIDLNETLQNTISLKNVPTGEYTKLRFILGVDSARNTSGLQDGYLDPSYGMIWTWNTGYIFFKHEGNFTNSANQVKPLRFHLGTEVARGFVEVTLPKVNVNGINSKLTIDFDLNKAYSSTSNIDFNVDNDRQSTEEVDRFWISNLKNNLEKSFSYKNIE
jgi:hypothetical protein